ncbi:hypothetical protein Lbir_3106 [Legionella birminghamensis]|uniref:Uncharacterized protein n=1 Tax=Legionella birminghamensis TaxID=28083 RepID=A0A378ILQ3_9GAMM|nr:hypothetical protein Lbir_3106 [Legionella birminghamensis]STX33044.1 Uncharacterised protein [Legionella birminghamensis]
MKELIVLLPRITIEVLQSLDSQPIAFISVQPEATAFSNGALLLLRPNGSKTILAQLPA